MSTPTIKILLVEDNPGDVGLIQALLMETRAARWEIEPVDRLSEALERLARPAFDAILLDLSLPDSRGLDTLARTRAAAPLVPIVLLTGQEDEELGMKAVREGAADYLVKGQATTTALTRALLYAIERQRVMAEQMRKPPARVGKVIGVIGAKGGAGATTVALNVAAALSTEDRTVIAAELRSYFGGFSLQLGRAGARNLCGLLQIDPARISDIVFAESLLQLRSGLRVLFGPQKVEEFQDISRQHAESLVRMAASMADYTVLDLPPHPSSAGQIVARRCDQLALVVERDPACVRAGVVALQMLRSWGASDSLIGAVVVNHSALATPMDLGEVESQLGCRILGVVPPAAETCLIAQRMGAPLVISQPDTIVAGALREIAGRLA